jgi:transcriptional regulator with XRE-family HTH domain
MGLNVGRHLLSNSSVSVNTISQAAGGRSLKALTAALGTGQRYAPDGTGAMVTRFGDELRRCMTERSMSTRQLADLVPCDYGYVSKLTRGVKQVSLEMAARMDDVLDAGGALIEASRNRETPDLAARRLQSLTTAQAEELLGHMQEQWHALVKTDNLLGPRYALTAVLSHLDVIGIILRSVRPQARSRALSLAARYAESAAWLHEDSGDLDGSRHWARRCKGMPSTEPRRPANTRSASPEETPLAATLVTPPAATARSALMPTSICKAAGAGSYSASRRKPCRCCRQRWTPCPPSTGETEE